MRGRGHEEEDFRKMEAQDLTGSGRKMAAEGCDWGRFGLLFKDRKVQSSGRLDYRQNMVFALVAQ